MKITVREKAVLELIAYEMTAKEIASELFISPNTVFSHRKKLMKKLEARNIAGLVRRGFEQGILILDAQ